ncbi:DUF4222 domain-containing protein [Escherichia coli]|uniref:DUF4222 domain-containing protein n=1 Tax=Escherichia coli TaxID=562 RepID=UPI0008FEFB9F|nr:DUF4222 domain-containing protein [Escherichia coli]EIZ1241318.1 DUF4222 domain-containing protein [Escherichia coli]EJV1601171.1 DUF4222 domain-containing protein [Escherichia coli]EMD1566893.1 DUF4222 domain-containing protein [Escherichia coli]MBB9991031.1 DUF4222 domain-containing protein [Escherichia coli]
MSEDVPLPKVNQRYKDDHGALATVTSVEETRVVFMREGYLILPSNSGHTAK